MKFNLGKENKCIKCILEPLSGGESIEIKRLQFRKKSVDNIADIMQNGIKRENQELVLDAIECKKDEFEKLETRKRYKATFLSLADMGNDVVGLIEIILGNIDICYDVRNVNYSSENVNISLANVVAYPYGEYSYRVIED